METCQCETHFDAVGKEITITCEECASEEWLHSTVFTEDTP